MTTRLIVLPAVLGMCLCLGCNNKGETGSQFSKVMEDDSGTKLLPVRLTERDKGILGPTAATEGAATPTAGGTASAQPAETKVPIEDSSAQAAADSFIKIMAASSLAQLPEIVVEEQAESARQLATAAEPLIAAMTELRQAVSEKFAGHAVQIPPASFSLPEGVAVEVTPVEGSETEADAKLTIPGKDQPEEFKVKQVDGKWRVEMPQILVMAATALGTEQVAAAIAKQAEALRGVAAQVKEDKIPDAAAVDEAVKAAMTGTGGSGGPVEPAKGDDTAAEEAKPAEDAAPKAQTPPAEETAKPTRQREQVDEVYSGPGMLRAR